MRWPFAWRSDLDVLRGLANNNIALMRRAKEQMEAMQKENLDLRQQNQEQYLEIQRLNSAFSYEKDCTDKLRNELQILGRVHSELRLTITERNMEIQHLKALPQSNDECPALKERSKLTRAIRDQSRQPDGSIDRRLVSHFRGQANQLRREGLSTDDIIEAISTWQTTENGEDRLTVDRIVATFSDERTAL